MMRGDEIATFQQFSGDMLYTAGSNQEPAVLRQANLVWQKV
jgi:hypothetical protein